MEIDLSNNKETTSFSNKDQFEASETGEESKAKLNYHRIRRTLSAINSNRKRAVKFCTLNRMKRNRSYRLTLNNLLQSRISKLNAELEVENIKPRELERKLITKNRFKRSSSTASLKYPSASSKLSSAKKLKLILKSNENLVSDESTKHGTSFKRLKPFRLTQHRNGSVILSEIKMQTIPNLDSIIKDLKDNQAEKKKLSKNDELSNKIDLEIRILDGILKLLNAICNNNNNSSFNAANLNQSNQQSQGNANYILPTNSSNQSSNVISAILNNTLNNSQNDQNKFTAAGLAIAAAIMSSNTKLNDSINPILNSSNSSNNANNLSNNSNTLNAKSSLMTLQNELSSYSSFENNQIYQILSACKCLFVSHRKISIYMHLKQLEENEEEEDNLSELDNNQTKENDLNQKDDFIENSIKLDPTIKLMLSEIRIPLSWKWNDHQKALKNSDSSVSKYVTFAVIYLGNMVYDTQLISNVDASMTEICFNEMFIFDDVQEKSFELTIEIYSYELMNQANNILQSARKLVKQFADFSLFKRSNSSNQQQQHQQQIQQQLNQIPNGMSNENTMGILEQASNHSYSLYKFKLIAKSTLRHVDISDQIETRDLKLVNESNSDSSGQSFGSSTSISSAGSGGSNLNKLPLFDYYCCRLRVVPNSSDI